jgi:hypothetical protein
MVPGASAHDPSRRCIRTGVGRLNGGVEFGLVGLNGVDIAEKSGKR